MAPGLPFVDEHAIAVDAPPERTWAALGEALPRAFSSNRARWFATAVGCRDRHARGSPLETGSAVPGFHVERAEPGAELALEGEHRFSRYALTFRIEPWVPGRSRLRAETRAEFPGLRGRAYRAMVVGTRVHVVAVRRILSAVRRRAERSGSPPHYR